MNVDHILDTMNRHGVDYLLIGGMNFFVRHRPVATFDVDLWIADTTENRARCEESLRALEASWGATERDWGPVARLAPGWLEHHGVYCLTSPSGDIDIFRAVRGLPDWTTCRQRAAPSATAAGVTFLGLADLDMLACQLALPEGEQKIDRVRFLRKVTDNHA